MEGTAADKLAEYARTHPEIRFGQVEGNHYAWKPEPDDEFAGEMSHARTEAELLAKLPS
jgi:hypothetical protein